MNQRPSNSAGIASLVLGIVGIVSGCSGVLSFVGLVLGIVGIVLSSMSKRAIGPNGMATAGLVLSIIAIVICGIVFALCAFVSGAVACASFTLGL